MKLSKAAILVSLFFCGSSFAEEVKIVGNIKQSVHVAGNKMLPQASQPLKEITLLKIQLSNKARESLVLRAEQSNTAADEVMVNSSEETQVQLGMGNVPVLDQGGHGTCATFANTAAIDAVINKGDYVSQLCHLELGQYLEQSAYLPSGWSGSLGRFVLHQIDSFGIVNTEKQKTEGCGGLKSYPLYGMEPKDEISVADFHEKSESLDTLGVAWSPIMDIMQFVFGDKDSSRTLEDVKASLRAGDRVTFGVILPDYHLGVVGAVGRFHGRNDSWVLTPEIERDIPTAEAAHEMVITGYDDNAVAKDDMGREYRGLLTLRNSWGSNIGDKGDFYMSYDYFKALTIEAQRIRSLK